MHFFYADMNCETWICSISISEFSGLEFVVRVRDAPFCYSFQGHGVRKPEKMNPVFRS